MALDPFQDVISPATGFVKGQGALDGFFLAPGGIHGRGPICLPGGLPWCPSHTNMLQEMDRDTGSFHGPQEQESSWDSIHRTQGLK